MSKRVSVLAEFKVNMLTVIEEITPLPGSKIRRFRCKCDCGITTEIDLNNLKSGHIMSCGCMRATQKGLSRKYPENNSLYHAKRRCLNPNDTNYPNYGGRGIGVCDRWLDKKDGLQNFIDDMGSRPSPQHSLDRIDNDGDYSPENCRWATKREQALNRSDQKNSIYLTYKNVTQTLPQWARELNISIDTLTSRHYRRWSDEDILTTPIDVSCRKHS